MGNYPLSAKAPIRKGQILSGALFAEPMRVEKMCPNGPDSAALGLLGLQTGTFRRCSPRRASTRCNEASEAQIANPL